MDAAKWTDKIAPADPDALDGVAIDLMKAIAIGVSGILVLTMRRGVMGVYSIL